MSKHTYKERHTHINRHTHKNELQISVKFFLFFEFVWLLGIIYFKDKLKEAINKNRWLNKKKNSVESKIEVYVLEN